MKQSVVWNEIHDRCATIFTQISTVNIFRMFLEAVLELTISILVAVHSPLSCGRLSVRSAFMCIHILEVADVETWGGIFSGPILIRHFVFLYVLWN